MSTPKQATISPILTACAVGIVLAASSPAQVHYHPDGRPWKQRPNNGPDAEVDGWYYNLGITGIRVQLITTNPTATTPVTMRACRHPRLPRSSSRSRSAAS